MAFFYLVCEAVDTAATPGLLCQPRVIVKLIVEKQMECRLAGETEVLGENLPQRQFCLTWHLFILFLICPVGLWVLRPLLAYCTSPG
jgi:hypothetical protein